MFKCIYIYVYINADAGNRKYSTDVGKLLLDLIKNKWLCLYF